MDYGHEQTDKELKKLENRISKEYQRAAVDVKKKSKEYMEKFKAKDKIKREQLKNGEITKADYNQWKTGQIMIGKRWEEMRDTLYQDLSNAKEIAKSMTTEFSYDVYALNHNYGTFEVESGSLMNTSYTLYDRDTVYTIIKEKPTLLPNFKESQKDIEKDKRWSLTKMNSAVLQGILQGESMDGIAKRLSDVVGMDEKIAIRNARTMTTAAENLGRQNSYKRAEKMGIKLENQWVATLDSRTRDSHRMLDGETRKVGDQFSNGLEYPGDPNGKDPSEIYNCRCTLIAVIENVQYEELRDEKGNILTKDNALGDMSYEEWYEARTGKKFYVGEQAEQIATTTESLRNAYEYHRTSNNLTSVSVDKLPEGFIGANYGNISQETIEAFDKTFEDLTAKYDTPLTQVRLMDKTEFTARPNAFASTRHGYETDTAMIAINPAKCGDHKKMVERLKELMSSGYAVQVDESMIDRYVPTHEFAHSIIDMVTPLDKKRNWVGVDYDKITLARKEIEGVFESYIKDVGAIETARKELELQAIMGDLEAWEKAKELAISVKRVRISEYSMLNADEFLAEAFTQSQIGVASNKYADQVMTIIDRLFARK